MTDNNQIKENSESTDNEHLLKYFLKQEADKKQESQWHKNITAIAALIASISAMVGGVAAYSSSNKVDVLLVETRNIQATNDENSRLMSLWQFSGNKISCNPIPLSESNMWIRYKSCISRGSENISNTEYDFGGIPNELRIECGIEVDACKHLTNNN